MASADHAFNAIDREDARKAAEEHAENKPKERANHPREQHFRQPFHLSVHSTPVHDKT